MAQDYKLLYFKDSDYKDSFGNTWCDASFEGISEPVKWVVKDVSKIELGKLYYGEITMETSKANKPYRRFRTKQKPEENTGSTSSSSVGEDIRAQFAIKAAVALLRNPEADIKEDLVLHWARIFYAMVDKVKQHTGQDTVQDKVQDTPQTEAKPWDKWAKDKIDNDVPDKIPETYYDDLPPVESYADVYNNRQ